MYKIHNCVIMLCFCCMSLYADTASWYGNELRGHLMANGKPFNPDNLTAASWAYPLGTTLRVTSGSNSVIVKITDRGPAKRLVKQGRTIDLSRAAFAKLANPDLGLITVSIAPTIKSN